MDINRASLDAILTNFRVIFNGGLQIAQKPIERIATVVDSTFQDETYPIGAFTATFHEWLGDRVLQDVALYLKRVPNRDFEGTIQIPRNSILDDRLGVYDIAIRELGVQASAHPWKLAVNELMVNGFDSGHAGFDGVPFFSAAHTWKGGYETAQSNTSTAALAKQAVIDGIASMLGRKLPSSEPADAYPDVFICGPDNWVEARTLFLNERDQYGASNPLYKLFKEENILVEPRVPAKYWAMLDTTKVVKPILFQRRQPPQLIAQVDPSTSEEVFMRKRFLYGVDWRGEIAALAWWLAYGSTGAVN